MRIVKETPDYVLIRWHNENDISYSYSSKEKKYLCIGGSYDGQKRSYTQLEDLGYLGFNCSDRLGNLLVRQQKGKHSKIWVHESKLI